MEREQQLANLETVVRDLRVAANDLARAAEALPAPPDDADNLRRIRPAR
jgi:hypothetical protein